ncbi:cysteine hydrolase [Paenibacillus aestuarii]|uniref:Cysteine hydrolase n=1 Tax=Paenibacillus aestuarii TaxID=516965 RepID=A0ABW0KG31_9BACL|nr:cysteine hydrolase [Paenibacillus aestuarii]
MSKTIRWLLLFLFQSSLCFYALQQPVIASESAPQQTNAGMRIDSITTALVFTDPQNDYLSPKGVAWNLMKESIAKNHTIENIELLLKTAKENKYKVFISPHYYYPYDQKWLFGGVMEDWTHANKMFQRKGPLTLEGFEGSGADFFESFKPLLKETNAVITSPHKIYGPESNDLVLQLRKAGITRVLLGGMAANLCVESHLRELVEQGFEVAVIYDATAAPIMDGDMVAKTNFKMIASASWPTSEVVQKMKSTKPRNQ